MIGRAIGAGWQTILADLSLILFMVTAAALAEAPESAPAPAPKPSASAPPASAPRAEAVAVWRDDPGAPPLRQWLASIGDPRLHLTITVAYAPGKRAEAAARAAALAAAAGPRGAEARLVIEPGRPAGISAVLGYDRDPPAAGTGLADTGV